jgi:hypothetical protein
MKKKLRLNSLSIQSFITSVDEAQLRGGDTSVHVTNNQGPCETLICVRTTNDTRITFCAPICNPSDPINCLQLRSLVAEC